MAEATLAVLALATGFVTGAVSIPPPTVSGVLGTVALDHFDVGLDLLNNV